MATADIETHARTHTHRHTQENIEICNIKQHWPQNNHMRGNTSSKPWCLAWCEQWDKLIAQNNEKHYPLALHSQHLQSVRGLYHTPHNRPPQVQEYSCMSDTSSIKCTNRIKTKTVKNCIYCYCWMLYFFLWFSPNSDQTRHNYNNE